MESRTRNLAWILAAAVAALVVLWGTSSWMDENTRLDNELASLQKKARLAASGVPVFAGDAERADLERRLRPAAELPTPVAFAAQVREALKRSGLSLEDFAVQELPGQGGQVRAQASGTMAQWMAFQTDVGRNGPVVFRSVAFDTDQGRFHIKLVVGYAAHP